MVITSLLGCSPASSNVLEFISSLATAAGLAEVPEPDVKSYSDCMYINYYKLGISLSILPKDGSKSFPKDLVERGGAVVDGIDIYNTPGQSKKQPYSTYPALPLLISLPNPDPHDLELASSTTGKDIVKAMGEPQRKGGGVGPSTGSIGIWCEWSNDGVMVEFAGEGSRGPEAWERGKDSMWGVLTLFRVANR